MNYMAFGQIAFFGDFGNSNNMDVSMCAKLYGQNCAVNYGLRAHVCARNGSCSVACDLYLEITGSDLLIPGASSICRRVLKCNLASCPDPTVCLSAGDPMGCSPVANLDLGERIVYELYENDQTLSGVGAITSDGQVENSKGLWWVGLVIGLVIGFVVLVTAIAVFIYKKKKLLSTETF